MAFTGKITFPLYSDVFSLPKLLKKQGKPRKISRGFFAKIKFEAVFLLKAFTSAQAQYSQAFRHKRLCRKGYTGFKRFFPQNQTKICRNAYHRFLCCALTLIMRKHACEFPHLVFPYEASTKKIGAPCFVPFKFFKKFFWACLIRVKNHKKGVPKYSGTI